MNLIDSILKADVLLKYSFDAISLNDANDVLRELELICLPEPTSQVHDNDSGSDHDVESSDDELHRNLDIKNMRKVKNKVNQKGIPNGEEDPMQRRASAALGRLLLSRDSNLPPNRTSKRDVCVSVLASKLLSFVTKKTALIDREFFKRIVSLQTESKWQLDVVVLSLLTSPSSRLPFSVPPPKASLKSTTSARQSSRTQKRANLMVRGEDAEIPWALENAIRAETTNICRNGGLTTICWGLLSTRRSVRFATVQLLSNIFRVVDPSDGPVEAWPALFEQGVIMLLEIIAIGIPVICWNEASAAENLTAAAVQSVRSGVLQTLPNAISCTALQWERYYAAEKIAQIKQRECELRAELGDDVSLVSVLGPSFAVGDESENRVATATPSCPANESNESTSFVRKQPDRFPEANIRARVAELLQQAGEVLMTSFSVQRSQKSAASAEFVTRMSGKPTAPTKSSEKSNRLSKSTTGPTVPPTDGSFLATRIISALLFSGNATLRKNIFIGLLFATGRCPELGRLLWSSSAPIGLPKPPSEATLPYFSSERIDEGKGEIFLALLEALNSDILSYRTVLLDPILFFLETAFHLRKSRRALHPSSSAITFSLSDRFHGLSPTVSILSQETQQFLKMQCPPMSVIVKHGSHFSSIMLSELEKVVQLMSSSNFAPSVGSTGAVAVIDKSSLIRFVGGLRSDQFLRLQGSYHVWQEIFSHMLGDYMLQTSLTKMSNDDILEAACLARAYGLEALQAQYENALLKRLQPALLISVFQYALGIADIQRRLAPCGNNAVTKPRLSMVIECVKYMRDNFTEKLRRKRELQSVFQSANSLLFLLFKKLLNPS